MCWSLAQQCRGRTGCESQCATPLTSHRVSLVLNILAGAAEAWADIAGHVPVCGHQQRQSCKIGGGSVFAIVSDNVVHSTPTRRRASRACAQPGCQRSGCHDAGTACPGHCVSRMHFGILSATVTDGLPLLSKRWPNFSQVGLELQERRHVRRPGVFETSPQRFGRGPAAVHKWPSLAQAGKAGAGMELPCSGAVDP